MPRPSDWFKRVAGRNGSAYGPVDRAQCETKAAPSGLVAVVVGRKLYRFLSEVTTAKCVCRSAAQNSAKNKNH